MSSNFLSESYARYSRTSRISIDHDVAMLIEMGYDDKLIEKVYNILHPRDITQAINYMTKENNVYNHPFASGKKSSSLCLICNEPMENHLNSYSQTNVLENRSGIQFDEDGDVDVDSESLSDEDDHNFLTDSLLFRNNKRTSNKIAPIQENIPINKGGDIQLQDLSEVTCKICEGDLSPEEQNNNTLSCQHFFCDDCWYEQLKQKITDNQVMEMTCANFKCQVKLTEQFIYSHLRGDKKLEQKYEDFKIKSSIANDPNKKFCPTPNCKSFLKKELDNKFVSCQNGHQWCYECLKAWHKDSTCEEIQDKDFQIWSKGKILKRCPNCKIYTEKNEGCNHMTCTECKYQWCWLCEGKYEYGHYGDSGPCKGLQFKKINYLSELTKAEQERLKERPPIRPVMPVRPVRPVRPAYTHENYEKYIGPDRADLKTTLRGNTLYVIDNSSNRRQNNNGQNNENLTRVDYMSPLKFDDDLKVPLDDYYSDISEIISNVHVFPLCWHFFWAILTPSMYIYAIVYSECCLDIRKRWLRFILNVIGFICSLSIVISYFFYAFILCNIYHIIISIVDESIFTSMIEGVRVGCKDMKRIRRYGRFSYVTAERFNNVYNNNGNSGRT